MKDLALFSVSNGVLSILRDGASGAWTGRPDGMQVLEVRAVPDRGAAVALLDVPPGIGRRSNLLGISADGGIRWRGELPQGNATDSFIDFDIESNGVVVASTWSGYRVRLDPDDGQIIEQEFTK